MAMNPRRKSEAARRANQTIRNRTMVIMLLLGICTFCALFVKLFNLQVVQAEELQEKATAQQTRSTVLSPSRGTIFDRNHREMAMSATAETLQLAPREVANFVKEQKKTQEERAQRAAEKKEDYIPKPVRDEEFIIRGLSRILEVEEDVVRKRMSKVNSMYEILAKKMEKSKADELRRFINGEIDDQGNEITIVNQKGKRVMKENPKWSPIRLQGIYLLPDTKRYYTAQAPNVVGVVDGENRGAFGLEAKYDEALQGTSGFTINARDNLGQTILYQYEQYQGAENGNDLVLTIDSNVQSILQKGVDTMVKKFDAKHGGTGIIMNVNTGAIVAMASNPSFDPNHYGTIQDEKLKAALQANLAKVEQKRSTYETEEDYKAALAKAQEDALNMQWRNRCIADTYEPGSTFKPITLAAALEEGVVDMGSSFYCSGSVMVPGWHKPFHCSKKSGHGSQNLKEAVAHSCNPAFISMGQKLGTEKYYDYLQSFGLMERTGVDMIGEQKGIFADRKSFSSNQVSLASYSFGQTFNVTPLELVRAQAACINGGYLLKPYVVDQVLDGEGNIVQQHGEVVPVRQVVSEETSAKVRQCLEYTVANGTGRNGQVPGYRIGGKTGTADKTGTRTQDNPRGDVVVSFMSFAPADDPQYLLLLTLDTPSRNTGTYVSGGSMVGPFASQIMSEILPVLGVEPNYSAEELVGADAPVPNTVGLSAEAAKEKLKANGFACRTVGEGDKVTAQTPEGGAIVPNNASIILYLGVEKPSEKRIVPNVVGLTAAEANRKLSDAGLIMRVTGVTKVASGNVKALSQSQKAGTELESGAVVTVRLGDSSSLD